MKTNHLKLLVAFVGFFASLIGLWQFFHGEFFHDEPPATKSDVERIARDTRDEVAGIDARLEQILLRHEDGIPAQKTQIVKIELKEAVQEIVKGTEARDPEASKARDALEQGRVVPAVDYLINNADRRETAGDPMVAAQLYRLAGAMLYLVDGTAARKAYHHAANLEHGSSVANSSDNSRQDGTAVDEGARPFHVVNNERLASAPDGGSGAHVTILNVSYDTTRELYKDINAAFTLSWKQRTGDTVTINMSHGASAAQSRAVIDGLDADVVTLALANDVDAISQQTKLIPADWKTRLPQNSAPYTSTIVFLVRAGNPWKINDWPDLLKPGVHVIVPNPKTSGGGRWAYLAAWAYAQKAPGGNKEKARTFVANLYRYVPILDNAARGSTTTFAQKGIGDVLLSWESEARLALRESGGASKFQIVYPSSSILAEPAVTMVDQNINRHGTWKIGDAYLQFLYSPRGQEIEASNFYRPRDAFILKAHVAIFPDIPLYTVDNVFGGWAKAQQMHFAAGGTFDQIYKPGQ